MTAKEKLLMYRRIDSNGCWLWTGGKTGGYGTTWFEGEYHPVHRLAYSVFKGPIGDGLLFRHTCDVPACFNPEHLIPGTQKENMQDMRARGRNFIRRGNPNYICKARVTVTIDRDVWKLGTAIAANNRRSFSSFLEALICAESERLNVK